MDFTFFAPWDQVLPREPGHVVAVAGGRGKVVLLEAMGAALAAAGVPALRRGPGEPDPGDAAVVLADVDGPSALPLRAVPPAGLWPPRTSLAVVEVGADCVGGRADAALAPEDLPTGLEPWTPLEWEHLGDRALAAVAAVPAGVPVVLAVGGLQDQPDSIGLFGFMGRMMASPRVAVALLCTATGTGLSVRACCRADGP